MTMSSLKVRLRFQDIFCFLVIWEFFFSDNRLLRIYPYVFWPLASIYAAYKLRNANLISLKYIVGVCISIGYAFISAFVSGTGSEGYLFLAEVLLYILPCTFISERCEKATIVKYIFSLTIVHLVLLFAQFLIPELFYSFEAITGGPEMVAITRANAISGIYMGLTGQTSTISFYLVLGVSFCLYEFSKNRTARYIILLFLFFVGVLLTNRRGSLVCAIVITALYLVLGKEKFAIKVLAVVFVAGIISVIGIQNIPGVEGMINKIIILQERNHFLSGRDQQWQIALNLYNSHKAFGIGFAGFSQYSDMIHAHNSYIQKLCELGIIGTIIYMYIYVSTYFRSIYFYVKLRFQRSLEIRNTNDLNLLVVIVQTFIFIISFTEGIFETPALYVIIFLIQSFAVQIFSEEKQYLRKTHNAE